MARWQNIYYKDEGKGPVLLLVHGFCLDHTIWDYQAAALQDRYRIIRLDLPGFGNSPHLPKPDFELENLAQELYRFIEDTQLEEVIFVGHSLGGYVGLALAQAYPQVIKGLALINSSALADKEEKKASRERVNQFVASRGVEPYIRQFVPELFYERGRPRLADQVERVMQGAALCSPESLIRTNQAMAQRPSYERVLKAMAVPVLFLIGRDDILIPYEWYQEQVQWPPKASVHIFNQTGHMAMLERPQVSTLLLDTFAHRCEQQD